MLATILGTASFVGDTKSSCVDFIDQLNVVLTSNVLIMFSMLVSFKMFGGKPLECMVPDEFTSAEEQNDANMLTTVLGMLHYVGEVTDMDSVDRIHSYLTTNVLIGLAILVSFKQFGGKPLECMIPDTFPGPWEQSAASTMGLLDDILSAGPSLDGLNSGAEAGDSLHYKLTSSLLMMFAILVSFKQFGGKPIECMIPDMFSDAWEQYAENYCWAQDTYYVPIEQLNVAGMGEEAKTEQRISYYQWVPFFLLVQAACFRLPSLLWKYMAGHSGIKIHEIIKLASDDKNMKPEVKKAAIQEVVTHLQGALKFQRRLMKRQIAPHKFIRFFNLPYSAFFVSAMYLLTKFLYLMNACVQLFVMNKFMETDKYSWYGFGAMRDLLSGHTWEQTGVFPRVSLCDFQVRVMGNIQQHTIQCVLVINIFNEKIFIFLWFWYVTLVLFTAGSFVYWLSVTIIPSFSRRFISRHLEMGEAPFDREANKDDVERFVAHYLKSDGCFVIRMVTLHSGVIFGTELVLSLWRSFYGIEEECRRTGSAPISGDKNKFRWPTSGSGKTPDVEWNQNRANDLRLRKRTKSVDEDDKEEQMHNQENSLKAKLLPPELPPKPSAPMSLDMVDGGGGRGARKPPLLGNAHQLSTIESTPRQDSNSPYHTTRSPNTSL